MCLYIYIYMLYTSNLYNFLILISPESTLKELFETMEPYR